MSLQCPILRPRHPTLYSPIMAIPTPPCLPLLCWRLHSQGQSRAQDLTLYNHALCVPNRACHWARVLLPALHLSVTDTIIYIVFKPARPRGHRPPPLSPDNHSCPKAIPPPRKQTLPAHDWVWASFSVARISRLAAPVACQPLTRLPCSLTSQCPEMRCGHTVLVTPSLPSNPSRLHSTLKGQPISSLPFRTLLHTPV